MATAAYTAQIESFSRKPVYLVKLTVQGDIAGSTTFYFSNKDAPALSLQVNQDVRPYLLNYRGRPTRIVSDSGLTERARLTASMQDDPEAPAFDASVFSITTGGSFFQRLILTQPDYRGSVIEVLRGFVAPGFVENDFQTIFKGRLEDIDFGNSQTVNLVGKDDLALSDRQVPSEISDDNTATTTGGNPETIAVIKGSEITPPSAFGTKDYFPLTIRLDHTSTKEDVIIKTISTNTLTVQDNYLNKSEAFDDAAWTMTGGSVNANAIVGPFGGSDIADEINVPSTGNNIAQTTALAANGISAVFSVWIKGKTEGDTTTLKIEDAGDGSDVGNNSNQVTLTDGWARYQVASNGNFAAGGGNVKASIRKDVAGDTTSIYVYGAQVEVGAARSFYVGTDGNHGISAGRQAFGSSAEPPGAGIAFKEVVCYRQHLVIDVGINPVVIIRDLVNRGGLTDSQVDQDSFDGEFDFVVGTQLRRGLHAAGDTTIVKPRSLGQHIKEVRQQSLLDLWMTEFGKAKVVFNYKINNPLLGGLSISDEDNIVKNSSSYKGNVSSRVTRMFVYYDYLGGEDNKPESYANVQVTVDLAIEDASGQKAKLIFSKWIFRNSEAIALTGRTLVRFSRGARIANWTLDLKDDLSVDTGDFIFLDSEDIQGSAGATAERGLTQFQVMQKKDERKKGVIVIEALESKGRKIGLIAPVGFPDYIDATALQRQYGFIGDVNNNLATSHITAPFNLTAATYTVATARITQVGVFAAYTHAVGDAVWINAAGAPQTVSPAFYSILSKIDNNTIEIENLGTGTYDGRLRNNSDDSTPISSNLTGVASDNTKWRSGLIDGYYIL